MGEIQRREVAKGAIWGALAFTIGKTKVLLTPQQAKAQSVPFLVLTVDEVQTLEAIGDTFAIDASKYGIAHFIDQQISVAPEEALLSLRVSEARPPYVSFYRAALAGIEGASQALHQRRYAELTEPERYDFVNALRQNKLADWHGPPSQSSVYTTLRNDAIDVVYGTVEGFARLGVPYMPHIVPERSW